MKLNEAKLTELLNIASKKLGTNPSTLRNQLESGSFDKALGSLNGTDAMRLKQALSNPKTAEKLLSTPQAKAIYDKLTK